MIGGIVLELLTVTLSTFLHGVCSYGCVRCPLYTHCGTLYPVPARLHICGAHESPGAAAVPVRTP